MYINLVGMLNIFAMINCIQAAVMDAVLRVLPDLIAANNVIRCVTV